MLPIDWTLVEGFCGSAALTLHLLGARQFVVPYQGSKASLVEGLDSVVRQMGFWGYPTEVVLSDASPIAEAIRMVLDPIDRPRLLAVLEPLVEMGERNEGKTAEVLHRGMNGHWVPSDPVERAAQFLWLQRMAYASKAVGIVDGRWVTPGLNPTAAYGRDGTATFGEVKPQGRTLLTAIREAPLCSHVTSIAGQTAEPVPVGNRRTLVYLDPPYSDLAPVVAPVSPALRLLADSGDGLELDAALVACGLDRLRQPIGHVGVAIREVLGAAGVDPQILDAVVQGVLIDVVDDLVWSEWASEMALHDQSVKRDCAAIVANHPIAILDPPSPLACPGLSSLALGLRCSLRGTLADFYQATTDPPPVLSEALAIADAVAFSGLSAGISLQVSSADVALGVKRHAILRAEARQAIAERRVKPGHKTTGYPGLAFSRAELIELALDWYRNGASVMISEAEPIQPLVRQGWYARCIREKGSQDSPFKTKEPEWVTFLRAEQN